MITKEILEENNIFPIKFEIIETKKRHYQNQGRHPDDRVYSKDPLCHVILKTLRPVFFAQNQSVCGKHKK